MARKADPRQVPPACAGGSVVRSVVLQFNPGNKFACPVSSASHGLALMFFATRFSLARLLFYGGVGRCVLKMNSTRECAATTTSDNVDGRDE